MRLPKLLQWCFPLIDLIIYIKLKKILKIQIVLKRFYSKIWLACIIPYIQICKIINCWYFMSLMSRAHETRSPRCHWRPIYSNWRPWFQLFRFNTLVFMFYIFRRALLPALFLKVKNAPCLLLKVKIVPSSFLEVRNAPCLFSEMKNNPCPFSTIEKTGFLPKIGKYYLYASMHPKEFLLSKRADFASKRHFVSTGRDI